MITAGIDIGSLTTKVVIMMNGNVAGYTIKRTGSNQIQTLNETWKELLKLTNLNERDVKRCVATGYGRFNVPFADKVYTEITCHARGCKYLFPSARGIIDIGGQDSKTISLDENGRIEDFAMNDRCAAGTGRFLEVMSEALDVKLENFGSYYKKSTKKLRISSTCTVFAESEVVSLISGGEKKEDIIRGLCRAITERILSLTGRVNLEGDIIFTGGVAKNEGVIMALKEKLGTVYIPPEPQITGAIGAAILASELSD